MQFVDPDCLCPALPTPPWLADWERRHRAAVRPSPRERLQLTCELAAENARNGGGPFAAAIFERQTGALFAPGVNAVLSSGLSHTHAEVIAIARAQYRLGVRNLSGFELVSSCEPCAMCFGAILWSGVDALLYGAPGDFAREAGFDEGDKVPDWPDSLRRRGIAVDGPHPGAGALRPFQIFRERSGTLY